MISLHGSSSARRTKQAANSTGGAGRRGFTLVELLVVISIIVLLAGIIAPALFSAIERARRMLCATNLNNCFKSLSNYATQNDDLFPSIDEVDNHWRCIGRYGNEKDPGNSFSNTRSLFLLLRLEMASGGAFICPSAPETKKRLPSVRDRYDFPGREYVSYAFQVQKRFETRRDALGRDQSHYVGTMLTFPRASEFAIMADRSGHCPITAWHTYAAAMGGGYFTPDNSKLAANSENHGLVGQNVLYLDGHTKWTTHSRVGIDNDNIWTKSDGSDLGLPPQACYYSAPTSDKDSFLVH